MDNAHRQKAVTMDADRPQLLEEYLDEFDKLAPELKQLHRSLAIRWLVWRLIGRVQIDEPARWWVEQQSPQQQQ